MIVAQGNKSGNCAACLTVNFRLRAAPNTEAETLMIPGDAIVPVFARRADQSWSLINYEGLT
ncbi:MAG: hypothetical protein K8I30_24785, partial [Anaerolineae bacterium]|nr:hypothetical protein [Anaerolineae bacterium]